jgi:hypothetical protein
MTRIVGTTSRLATILDLMPRLTAVETEFVSTTFSQMPNLTTQPTDFFFLQNVG